MVVVIVVYIVVVSPGGKPIAEDQTHGLAYPQHELYQLSSSFWLMFIYLFNFIF